MSEKEVERFNLIWSQSENDGGLEKSETGRYCRYKDYEALEKERDELGAMISLLYSS